MKKPLIYIAIGSAIASMGLSVVISSTSEAVSAPTSDKEFTAPPISAGDIDESGNEHASPWTNEQLDLFESAVGKLQTQFADRSIVTLSTYFSLENVSASSIVVTDNDGRVYAWDVARDTYVEDTSREPIVMDGTERTFAPSQVSWEAVIDRIDKAAELFDDTSLVTGSLLASANTGDVVPSVDVKFTSAVPALKPAMTLTFDAKLIGVECWTGRGCDWLNQVGRQLEKPVS
jgi:hypothetical protein